MIHRYTATTQMQNAQDKDKDGARKDLLLVMCTKLRLVCYGLSMLLYRTWAVTSEHESLSLSHSLSFYYCRNTFTSTLPFSFRYALRLAFSH